MSGLSLHRPWPRAPTCRMTMDCPQFSRQISLSALISESCALLDNKFRPQTRCPEAKTPLGPDDFVAQRAKHENTYTTREGGQTKKRTALQRNAHTTRHNATQRNATQRNATQRNAKQTQHNTTQHNTTQHNTTQRAASQRNASHACSRSLTQQLRSQLHANV